MEKVEPEGLLRHPVILVLFILIRPSSSSMGVEMAKSAGGIMA
jgi:hypothetical protein